MALFDRLRLLWLALTMKPIRGAEDDPEPQKGDEPKGDPEPKGGGDPKPSDDSDDDADKVVKGDDLETKARKHERWAKKEKARRLEVERKLKEREDADKFQQEKAIERAKEEGRKEASAEAERARRADRLEVAVTRLAAKGFKVGEGDDAKTVRFRDAEDALVNIERSLGDEVDEEDIYDSEGRVNPDALQAALQGLAERKPHLVEDGRTPKPSGDADGGKGTGGKSSGGSKSVEDMSAQEHFERIRRNK